MRRVLVLAGLFGLALAPAAGAAEGSPANVEIGKVGLAAPVGGRAALLVPVRYPIQLNRQRVELRVFLRVPGQRGTRAWTVRTRASAGPLRVPEWRRRFTFVHQVDLSPELTRAVESARGRAQVRIDAPGALDINRDGVTELDSSDEAVQELSRAAPRLCASVPPRSARPGGPIRVELPACGARAHWRVAQPPANGSAAIRGNALAYRPATRFRGTESIALKARAGGGVEAPVEIVVEQGRGTVARAIGDSFTAGFGYYDDGGPIPLADLTECRPTPKSYDDACSSNSAVLDDGAGNVEYAPDYGLSNDVSWAAQWANDHGVSNYENLAVSGSAPSDWAPGGRLYATTEQVEAEEPDYVLMTIGGDPLLSDMLFGVDDMGCAIWSDISGKFRECVEAAFRGVDLRGNLESLYRELVDNTAATIDLMQYPLSLPSSALAYSAAQITAIGAILNQEIAAAAAAVSPSRLRVIAPPPFDAGLDVSPANPFPSAAGYAQMAAQAPAP